MTWSAFRTLMQLKFQAGTLTYDIYTDDRYHRLCFPTMNIDSLSIKQKNLLLENKANSSVFGYVFLACSLQMNNFRRAYE